MPSRPSYDIDYDEHEELDEYDHGSGKLHVGSYRVDPRHLVDVLGFEPSAKLRLPIEPIRRVIKAAAEAWLNLLRDRGLGSNPTPEEVRAASPALRDALLDLYVHFSTYGARRCHAPIPKQYPLIRQLFRGLIEQIDRAVPDKANRGAVTPETSQDFDPQAGHKDNGLVQDWTTSAR